MFKWFHCAINTATTSLSLELQMWLPCSIIMQIQVLCMLIDFLPSWLAKQSRHGNPLNVFSFASFHNDCTSNILLRMDLLTCLWQQFRHTTPLKVSGISQPMLTFHSSLNKGCIIICGYRSYGLKPVILKQLTAWSTEMLLESCATGLFITLFMIGLHCIKESDLFMQL